MNIIDFLAERLDEDEREFLELTTDREVRSPVLPTSHRDLHRWMGEGFNHPERPGRFLRDLAAKRRIVDGYRQALEGIRQGAHGGPSDLIRLYATRDALAAAVRALASTYADHDDFAVVLDVADSPDAMKVEHSDDGRLPVTVLVLHGDDAVVTTPRLARGEDLRVPVARLVADTGLSREDLPGARLVAVLGADGTPVRYERA